MIESIGRCGRAHRVRERPIPRRLGWIDLSVYADPVRSWTFDPKENGDSRLDRFLADRAGASRAQVRRWLERGCVVVDGRAERRGGVALLCGQTVILDEPASSWIGPLSDDRPLDVVGQGPDWVAVNKPAGVPVHPLEPDEPGSLLGSVAADVPSIVGVGDEGELRSGVVHRLDVDTSGVVLFALTDERWHALRSAFAEHRVRKVYHALVADQAGDQGLPDNGEQRMHLAVTRHRPARVRVVDENHPGARRCSLAWKVIARGDRTSLVEIDLHTGFLHQVRVMFAAMGHPLLGDAVYAPSEVAARAPRHMLHAASIAVDDLHAEAPKPGDFRDAMRTAGLNDD